MKGETDMADERKDLKKQIEETDSIMSILSQMGDREKEQIMIFAAGVRAARELYQPTTKKPA